MYSFRMSFWIVPDSCVERHALAPRDGDVERQQDDRRRVDRHRRRHAVERDAVEERRHVLDRVDRDADAADLAGGHRMVGVVAHLRRQVERDAQAADALREQVPVARVRFGGRAEAGILAHRPQPAAVHRRLDAAGVRESARDRRRLAQAGTSSAARRGGTCGILASVADVRRRRMSRSAFDTAAVSRSQFDLTPVFMTRSTRR